MKTLLAAVLIALALQPFRVRLAIVALLTIAHVDMSGGGFDSASSVGVFNAVKALVLPGWLLVLAWNGFARSQGALARRILWRLVSSPAAVVWLLLVGYVTIATLWSPFPLAGFKMVAALVSHTMVLVALTFLWLSGRLNERLIYVTVVLSFALAALQTVGLGNTYGSGEGLYFSRLTTFSSPQSFAASCVALGCVLIWYRGFSIFARLGALALLLGGSFASGSRIGFVGALAAVGIWLLRRVDPKRLLIAGVVALAGVGLLASEGIRDRLAESRVGEAVVGVSSGLGGIEEVGTFRWRADLYRCVWESASARGVAARVLGSGTASLGEVGLDCVPEYDPYSFSPNRVAHNEFLRALYEWGGVGLALFLLLVALVVRAGVRSFVRAEGSGGGRSGALASALPIFLLALSFENLIQGPLSPGMVALLVVLSQAAAAHWSVTFSRVVRRSRLEGSTAAGEIAGATQKTDESGGL